MELVGLVAGISGIVVVAGVVLLSCAYVFQFIWMTILFCVHVP